MLRERILCGINNTAMQTRLPEKADLTYEGAMKTALAMEAAKKDAGEIASSSKSSFPKHKIEASKGRVSCYRYGKEHFATESKHISTTCNFSRKQGYIARRCNSSNEIL
ncbi:hypothetical protein HPB49_006551 [Dermacentor silvarum]|uniref:Uncharacterized protein n=1 Tax=Dermacentor silvarum TaxID=543639 RepID=A0ACB8DWK0_DERSI|nr:hypothetical protein HPB49_006551 [Dermacentor silvarum]